MISQLKEKIYFLFPSLSLHYILAYFVSCKMRRLRHIDMTLILFFVIMSNPKYPPDKFFLCFKLFSAEALVLII